MKRDPRSDSQQNNESRVEGNGLGDIGRHWRASRMIAAREPAAVQTGAPAPPKRG